MERRPSQIVVVAEPVIGIEIGVAKVLVGIAVENVGALFDEICMTPPP